MKQRFLAFVQTIVNPWVDGASGTPWGFTTSDLMAYGNTNLEPDCEFDVEGEIKLVYLKSEEVEDVMRQLGYRQEPQMDPYFKMKLVWIVEVLPTTIL